MATDSTEGISFSPEALTFIRNNSLGIPCMMNLIFDGALFSAHTQKTTEIREEIVGNKVENFKFPREETEIAIPKNAPPMTNWINRMRMKVIIPSIISIFIGAIVIGFFISQNIMTNNAPSYKPEQELPILQYKLATPEDIEKAEMFKLAIFYQKSGELIKAREQYLKLIKIHPKDYEIHNNLGSVYHALGNFDTAINEYRKALLINPNYHKARNNLGVALYEKGNMQAAISEFKVIYEAKPKDLQCLTNLGVLSKELKHFDKAREFFEEVLSIDPEFTEAHYNLAIILKEKDVASAIFHFQKFLEYSDGQYASLQEKVIQHLDNLTNKPKVYSRNW
jgi:tetratricopeptide (TPR) repeat protein